MAPSNKRKRKPLPKRPCPCCGSILSEKTIERHSSGTHVPTRINVTLAAAARKYPNHVLVDYLSDASTDSTDLGFSVSDLDDNPHPGPAVARNHAPGPNPEAAEHAYELEPAVDLNTADEDDRDHTRVEEGRFNAKMLQDSWPARRSHVDSDAEEDFFLEGKDDSGDSDSDLDFGSDCEGEGIRNGLAIDDLVEEDLQRLIAEFSAPFFFFC